MTHHIFICYNDLHKVYNGILSSKLHICHVLFSDFREETITWCYTSFFSDKSTFLCCYCSKGDRSAHSLLHHMLENHGEKQQNFRK